MPETSDVRAAGAVVFGPKKRVLLVHRPKYDDWSFPKGKLDRGEHATVAAVREVEEETGLRIRLGPALGDQSYPAGARTKTVRYWNARVVGDDDVSRYEINAEIDGVAWVPYDEALRRLSYPRDVDTLVEAHGRRKPTRALVVLRHTQARSRPRWRGADTDRPLLRTGERAAARLSPVLAAYDVSRVVTSTATRCVQTVLPHADVLGVEAETTRKLTEERATETRIGALLEGLIADLGTTRRGAVLCTHRPVLPLVFAALGCADPELAPGEMVVFHLRQGRIVARNHHLPG